MDVKNNIGNRILQAAIVLAAALILSVFLYRYFSPYTSCVRDMTKYTSEPTDSEKEYIVYECAKYN